MNKKIKVIISVSLLAIGLSSLLFIPGGFTKDFVTNSIQQEQEPVELTTQPIMRIQPQVQQDVDPSFYQDFGFVPTKERELFMAVPEDTSISYQKVKTIYQEVLGIIKDLVSLAATIVGLYIAWKTFKDREEKTPIFRKRRVRT